MIKLSEASDILSPMGQPLFWQFKHQFLYLIVSVPVSYVFFSFPGSKTGCSDSAEFNIGFPSDFFWHSRKCKSCLLKHIHMLDRLNS